MDDDLDTQSSFPKRHLKRKRLARLVSQDGLETMLQEHRSTSPLCGVSEFDEASHDSSPLRERLCNTVPPLPNPLEDTSMLKTHIAALRLEAELHPMRSILTRLMSHQTNNRKGIFNVPVNVQALGLIDYHQIVTRPMDLGTIKRRLHAVAYQSREEVASDIRLVFTNAMRYNPPSHAVYKAAKDLLLYFEQSLHDLKESGESSEGTATEQITSIEVEPSQSSHPKTIARMVSTVEDEVSKLVNEDGRLEQGNKANIKNICSLDPFTAAVRLDVAVQKRSLRLPATFLPHSCGTCKGRTCQMCKQGCLYHEPALMVCHGAQCEGTRLRKGSVYYVSADGNRHYCQRCYTNLTPVIPGMSENDPCRYKQALLKRFNNEEIAEEWLNCSKCSIGVHSICAMHNGYVHNESDFLCLECRDIHNDTADRTLPHSLVPKCGFTFISGSDVPVATASLGILEGNTLTAESLPACAISSFIQAKVGKRMQGTPNADKTITVRVISDSSRHFSIPDVVRRHFRMVTKSDEIVEPPVQVQYRQKAITLFQKIDGLDVCIFCMYVQEYDDSKGNEADLLHLSKTSQNKRVYIAYIDSVEHFRPRECRTEVYQEILVAYLATTRARGFETAHIWACPPSRGNSFVFWNHPSSQRTPNHERLISWYHGALSRAIGCGVVTDVKSLFESQFEVSSSNLESENSNTEATRYGRTICPPLLDGDFWIEEAVRIHGTSLARHMKVRAPTGVCVWNVTPLTKNELDPCPALQIAALVKDRIMTHPSSVPFRRPVNAAAMNLKNYHDIVTQPMDLSTIHAQCVIGEYHQLRQVVDDIELMVSNAKLFNPVGHFVCVKADEVRALFYNELASLVSIWDCSLGAKQNSNSWESHADMSMSLDKMLDVFPQINAQSTSVFIEDDRSSDGSRSLNSSLISMPGSPMSSVALSHEMDDDTDKKLSFASLDKPKRCGSVRKGRGRGRLAGRRCANHPQTQVPPKKLDLLSDGPDAVMQRMVGEDLWLLDKRNPTPNLSATKTAGKKRRGSCSGSNESICSSDEPVSKRRRQSWVGEEVSEAVRRLRTSFFVCSLLPKKSISEAEQKKLREFQDYVDEYDNNSDSSLSKSSPICDARHALLEFSQYRHLEFDTLRRAKYSTAVLLYHLKNSDAPGVVPHCSSCNEAIQEVRWHKVKKATEKRRITKSMKHLVAEVAFQKEELCLGCHAQHSEKEEYVPIPVSLKLEKK